MTYPLGISLRRRGRRGFAIMELLIALALLGLIAVFVANSLTFGRRLWERTDTASQTGRQLAELGFLRNNLSQALVFADAGPGDKQLPFEGGPQQLSFAVMRAVDGLAAEMPYRVTITKAPRTNGLEIAATPLFDSPIRAPGSDNRILPSLTDLDVRYYGRLVDRDQARWQSAWQSQNNLPDLIELTLTFAGPDGPSQRILAIRPVMH